MSKNSLILVLQNKQENLTIDIAKIEIKLEKHTPLGGIFSGRGAFLTPDTFSCHGKALVNLALLIWLNESLRLL